MQWRVGVHYSMADEVIVPKEREDLGTPLAQSMGFQGWELEDPSRPSRGVSFIVYSDGSAHIPHS